ncbi:MAG: hypothetical protein L3J88_06535 [Gammaproteobacteria bacterium]|nr:hypothetical protein [Gammaproteobacteria bacterium]MCF6362991.1 hypothetical protein [Gammaproteobacteria bacterium]
MNKFGQLCVATLCVAAPFTATAGEIGEIQWHGFLTSAYLATSGAGEGVHYSGDVSDEGTTKDTRLGLTVTTQVDEHWRFAAQMKAKRDNHNRLVMDWAYATYDHSDQFAINVGEVKFPVGLYNEYVEVGYTYPWIRAPESAYNQDDFGPDLTWISYSGLGLVYTWATDETETNLNFFGGLLDLADGHINQMVGAQVGFNWADMLRLQLSATTGIMEIEEGSRVGMDGDRHTTYTASIGLDMESLVFSTEISTASMEMDVMDSTSGYVMMGYRFGDFMPHVTWGKWDVKGGWGQENITLGLRTELTSNTALKVEVKEVTPGDNPNSNGGYGLFNKKPEEDKVLIYGVALELVF